MKTIQREVLEFIYDDLDLSINRDEIRELTQYLSDLTEDFYIEIDGEEYRFIHAENIWDIYVEELREITEDCYDIKAPSWLAIDWQKTAENCSVDGYGHTFASYDGEEIEYNFNRQPYSIFRTN
jgi:hypothetical protein